MDAGLRRFLIVFAGLGCGLSPAFYGYFDISVWGPIALAVIALAVGLLIARPALPTGLAAVAVCGLALFAAWSLQSTPSESTPKVASDVEKPSNSSCSMRPLREKAVKSR